MRLVKVAIFSFFVYAWYAHFPALFPVQAKISPGPPLGMTGAPGEGACSGLTPGLVGLWQVNVQIPNTAPSGTNIEVQVSLGGRAAHHVTVAIE